MVTQVMLDSCANDVSLLPARSVYPFWDTVLVKLVLLRGRHTVAAAEVATFPHIYPTSQTTRTSPLSSYIKHTHSVQYVRVYVYIVLEMQLVMHKAVVPH